MPSTTTDTRPGRPRPGRFSSLVSGRNALFALACFAAVMTVMFVATTRFYDAHGVGILNLLGARNAADPRSGGYSADTAYSWLGAYGADGRRDHLLILLLDLPLMTSFAAFASITLRWAVPRAGRRLRTAFVVVPLAAVAFNLLEDLGLTALLLSYPTRFDGLAVAISTVNGLKSLCYAVSLFAVVGTAGARLLTVRGRRCRLADQS
ncbi:hypothetical protein [Kitasatospora sp. NPDC086791]|uniref:hypothetical protein n=1 Tax=Kitasatospora sp. NPDC086791 TaxID=3155178 RepID=UPI00342C5A59